MWVEGVGDGGGCGWTKWREEGLRVERECGWRKEVGEWKEVDKYKAR